MTSSAVPAPLEQFRARGVVEKTVGVNAGTPYARLVAGGSCWHCGTVIRYCVQAEYTGPDREDLRHGQVVDIGTTCAERIGMDRAELRAWLAELYAQERLERSKAWREARRAEHEAWEAAQAARFGPHGTEARYAGGCAFDGGPACSECAAAAPHGTADRFFAGECCCQGCVAAVCNRRCGLRVDVLPVLVSLATGEVIPSARLVDGQWGTQWWYRDAQGASHWVPYGRKRRSTVERHGVTYAHARYVVEASYEWGVPDRRVRMIEAPAVDDFGVGLAPAGASADGCYLVLHHDLGPPGDEYVGPFGSVDDAREHRRLWGPRDAEPAVLGRPPSDLVMTPEEHAEYLRGRP